MELKPNMYVRTKDGFIAKCIYIDEELESIYGFDSAIRRSFGDEYDFIYCKEQEKYIIKASYNIIDLIEVGDYVNGYNVAGKETMNQEEYVYTLKDRYGTYFKNSEIKSIVTKEQFESMSYKLEVE